MAILVGFVLFLNLFQVLGIINTNPVDYRSVLAVNRQELFLNGEHTIDPNDGFTKQALGRASADEILSFDLPLWNQFEGIGMPLAAEMQSAALFPLTILHSLENGTIIIHTILQIIGGIGMYLFLRILKIRRIGSLSGGILFALSGSFVWLTNAALNPVAFIPLLMLGVEYLYRSTIKKKSGGWILLAVSLALSLYSGFPETVYLYSILPIGWAILRLFDLEKSLRLKFIVKLLVGGLVGLLLAAPILILFGAYVFSAYIGSHGEGLATYHLSTYSLVAFVFPYIYGPIFGILSTAKDLAVIDFWSNVGSYAGVSIIFLAVIGLFSKQISRKYLIFLFTVVVIYSARTYGSDTLINLLNYIPGMSLLAVYRYAVPAIIFSLIVLAIFGIQTLIDSYSKRLLYIYFGIFSLILAYLAYFGFGLSRELGTKTVKVYFLASLILVFSCFVAFLFIKFLPKKYQYLALSLVLIFEVTALYLVPQLSTDKHEGLELSSVEFLKQNLGNSRFYTLGPIEPNYGSYFRIASINNNDLPVPKNWSEYIKAKLNSNTDPVLFTGTFMSDPAGPTPKQELLRNLDNYRDLGVKYVVVQSSLPFSDEEQQTHGFVKVHSDRVAKIYELSNPSSYFVTENQKCLIEALSKTSVRVDCPSSTKLIRKELQMPGWYTNFGPTIAYGDYGVFQAIDIPEGKSEIEYDYSPPYFNLAVVLWIIGALSLISGVIYNIYKRRLK